ncbi:NAD(P)-binding oxidoreductase [Cellulomonas sp. PSBB021]|uniref:NAD(P)-binding oxidoreductase n=1 Tax=Cellulomonas sp. PSBB021 TaxID=2003551 RepID=UPI000B8D3212|nr:NAD(P)-binding oxidoreductase [Cellulomonas sp. PSBB021]ASR55671.1 NAD-dependent dehydratase [Cellulomonas sp. PSBB021]
MRVVVAGGHGKVARHLTRALAARGDVPVALIRSLDQVEDVTGDGAEAVVLDLERCNVADVTGAVTGADAVVFAAGAGPCSGAQRKDTVDRAAAALLADAAQEAGVRRYVLVSSMGVDQRPPEGTDDVFAAYLEAKAASEQDLRGRDLDWTILRPGRLTDDEPTDHVTLERAVGRGDVPRGDVAAVLAALLRAPASAGLTLELVTGVVPVEAAVVAATERAD